MQKSRPQGVTVLALLVRRDKIRLELTSWVPSSTRMVSIGGLVLELENCKAEGPASLREKGRQWSTSTNRSGCWYCLPRGMTGTVVCLKF